MATSPTSRAPKVAASNCCVRIGGMLELVMPTDKGLKVIDLLRSAIECDSEFVGNTGYVYRLKDQALEAELKTIHTSQLRTALPPKQGTTT